VLIVLVARAVCNALTEELFWRGVYVRLFPDDAIRGYLYPALAFGAWHIIPQSVVPFGGGSTALVLGACFIGLGYGWVAWRTGSIRWTTLAHIGTDAMGIGAALIALGH
jgi:membrane protease YdiL (CAAX protease family)